MNFKLKMRKILHKILEDAKKIKKTCKIGDILEEKVSPQNFGHFAVRDFKSRLNEALVTMQKENMYNHFKAFENNMLNCGRVIDVKDDFYRLDIGKI